VEEWANVVRLRVAAQETGLAERYLVAAGIAESRLRNSWRRPERPSDDAEFWPDVSEGLLQQTVAWSIEYREMGGDPQVYPGPLPVAAILEKYRDPDHAIDRALPQLVRAYEKAEGDDLDALCYYNKPNRDPAKNTNRHRYEAALGLADRILAGEPIAEVLELHKRR
jgi:hypothetical protein